MGTFALFCNILNFNINKGGKDLAGFLLQAKYTKNKRQENGVANKGIN